MKSDTSVLQILQSIQQRINRVNDRNISNAHNIEKFAILPQDFTIFGEELGKHKNFKFERNSGQKVLI